jgi:hypothetical protein
VRRCCNRRVRLAFGRVFKPHCGIDIGDDPFHFTKAPEVLIETGPPGSIDETFAHKPSIIFHDGALYHFYCAVSGRMRGVGGARSKPW